jgi:CelD/BcsL family acetyltransferase involved in cellulose biosynthesis
LDGHLLASHLGLSYKGRYFSPKVAYNEDLKQWAPGHLIVEEILRDCAARDVREYDITGPSDPWKAKWTSQTRQQKMQFIFAKGVSGDLAHAIRFRLRPWLKKITGQRGPTSK